jgi:hypothetical protein
MRQRADWRSPPAYAILAIGGGEAQEKIARNALQEGASVEFIQKITGLSIEAVERIAGE